MSEQASSQADPARASGSPADFGTSRDGSVQPLRALGLAAVGIGVAALAAATFVLSYSGIHAVARQAGISARYASDYPLLIDAMLVIALLAVLALRGAGIPSRILAWLTLLAVLAAAAGADALHATGHTLPHNASAATAAVLPWALVLLAFVLLLALLRHARLRRQAGAARRRQAGRGGDGRQPDAYHLAASDARPDANQPVAAGPTPLPVRIPQQWNSASDSASIVPGLSSRLVSSAAAGAAAGAVAATAEPYSAGSEAGVPGGGQGTDGAVSGSATAEGDAPEAASDAGPADQVGAQPAEDLELSGESWAPSEATANALPDGTRPEPGDKAPVPRDADAEQADTEAAPADTQAAPADAAGDQPGHAEETPAGPREEASLAADAGGPGTHDPLAADQQTSDPQATDLETAAEATEKEDTGDEGADEADGMPVFHRMWSTPTPPDS
jgi:Protein of unknown function (DUF2637)